MLQRMKPWHFAAASVACFVSPLLPQATAVDIGATRIARWPDDKQATFLLMFDDSMPSHVRNVVPELQKRGLTGTFYINPGKGEWGAFKDAWEKDFPAAGMVYGNHTMTHKGAHSVAIAEQETSGCSDIILKLFPGKQPHLLSFGRPGVKPEDWTITDDQLAQLLAKYHLIERPPFHGHGAVIHHKTGANLLRLVDRAIDTGSIEYVIFHGVGGEWISIPKEAFIELVDGLAAKRDQLWVTDHISAHQYATERDTAEVRVLEASPQRIRLLLTAKANPQFYDFPLTLITPVPATWRACEVSQGKTKLSVTIADGTVRYKAAPNAQPITIQQL